MMHNIYKQPEHVGLSLFLFLVNAKCDSEDSRFLRYAYFVSRTHVIFNSLVQATSRYFCITCLKVLVLLPDAQVLTV